MKKGKKCFFVGQLPLKVTVEMNHELEVAMEVGIAVGWEFYIIKVKLKWRLDL
jgi:hypothetical protein